MRITSASVVSTTRPRGTSVAGRSTRIVRSSRSRVSAPSSCSRAAVSRASCTLRYDAAEPSARRLSPPATIFGIPPESWAARP